MLILLCVLFLVLTIVLGFCYAYDYVIGIFAFIFIVLFFITIVVGVVVVNGRTIDERIAMYQEENENIESDMNILVEQYMNYESDTLGELKADSSITLVSLYPELKADTLVTKQIEVYIANNEKIKSLKEDKINLSVMKWWLYFGKVGRVGVEDAY